MSPCSKKQLRANRRNYRLSTGPKTLEGKQKVRWNALKHGLLAKSVVIPTVGSPENRTEFFSLLEHLQRQLQPVGILEEMLVEKIAVAYWRLRRAVRAEAGEIGEQLEDWRQRQNSDLCPYESSSERRFHTNSLAIPSRDDMNKILRYETTISRSLNNAIKQLKQLQKQRQQEKTSVPDKISGETT